MTAAVDAITPPLLHERRKAVVAAAIGNVPSPAYALAVAIFGGFAPFIATWLISMTGSPLSPAFYVIAAAVVSFLVIWRMPETAHEPLR